MGVTRLRDARMKAEDSTREHALRIQALRLITDSPLPDGMKARFLQDADEGEWEIAVEDVCCQIYEYDYRISQDYYQVLSGLYEDLGLDRGDLELVAEHCVRAATAPGRSDEPPAER